MTWELQRLLPEHIKGLILCRNCKKKKLSEIPPAIYQLIKIIIIRIQQKPKQTHTWQSSAGDTPGLGCCQSVGRSFWSCGAGGWWDTGGPKRWAGTCCSREAGCYCWFHCDSHCPCRPQRCLGLRLQSRAWQETLKWWTVLPTQSKERCLMVFMNCKRKTRGPGTGNTAAQC